MTDWREEILTNLPKTYIPLTIVSDPDGVLQDLEINNTLHSQGYDILYYHSEEDFTMEKYSFRHRYESIYRTQWDQGKQHKLILAFCVNKTRLASVIPYDLWVKAKKIHLTLHTLFPQLSYPVVSELQPSEINRLFKAYQLFTGTKPLGENASTKYVLTRVYPIDPDNIVTIEDLFSALLKIHYGDTALPPRFRIFLTEQLKRNPDFKELPLDQLLENESFFRYLQSEWATYVNEVEEETSTSKVPFEHHHIRPLIDNLFTERRLHPIHTKHPELLPAWMHIGIKNTPIQANNRLLIKKLDSIEATLQGPLHQYRDWQRVALNWAEVIVQKHQSSKISPECMEKYEKVHRGIQEKFTQWTLKNHQTLYNLRLRKPLIVSHICDYLHSKIQKTSHSKVALLVLDGISLDQWILLQRILQQENPTIEFDLGTLYAAIPTLTSVSRQAIFSGKSPFFFEETLLTTNEDGKHWKRFWNNNNIEAGYKRGLMLTREKEVEECMLLFTKRVIGLVVNFVDKSMHGGTLGTAGMHDIVKGWLKKGYLMKLLETLLDHGYEIYIGSDHGNIEATGIGVPRQGALVEQSGSRVRIYENNVFAEQAQKEYPESILWSSGSPDVGYTYLFTRGKTAFRSVGTETVTHGGINLEEVIVPFVHVRRNR
jgi:hypothetical protein